MNDYVRLDVSKDETSFCVKNLKGEVLAYSKILSAPDSLFECLREHCLCPELVVMKIGLPISMLSSKPILNNTVH